MPECDYLELLELQEIIRAGVEDAIPGTFRVRAEIASIHPRANGHCYLDLCESGPGGIVAQVKAIMWRSSYNYISTRFRRATGKDLEEGMDLVFEVRVNYHSVYGLSLIINDIDVEHTLGEAELRRRQTIERLTEEGLMDLQKELSLPAIPYSLAVISAEDAAGYGDFRRHLLENEYGFAFDIILFPATMQGEGAPSSICEALSGIQASGRQFDAVFILRGGGSVLDLSCFDDYGLCAAIAQCPYPVWTAIGHDRDSHVADAVACGSVKTPTALADLCISALAAEDERREALRSRIRLGIEGKIASAEAATERAASRIANGVRLKISTAEAATERAASRIRHGIYLKLSDAETKTERAATRIANGVRLKVVARESDTDRLASRIAKAVSIKILNQESAAGRLALRISSACSVRAGREEARLSALQARIMAADPSAILSRGYALVTDARGGIVKSAKSVRPGDALNIRYSDGTIPVHADGTI